MHRNGVPSISGSKKQSRTFSGVHEPIGFDKEYPQRSDHESSRPGGLSKKRSGEIQILGRYRASEPKFNSRVYGRDAEGLDSAENFGASGVIRTGEFGDNRIAQDRSGSKKKTGASHEPDFENAESEEESVSKYNDKGYGKKMIPDLRLAEQGHRLRNTETRKENEEAPAERRAATGRQGRQDFDVDDLKHQPAFFSFDERGKVNRRLSRGQNRFQGPNSGSSAFENFSALDDGQQRTMTDHRQFSRPTIPETYERPTKEYGSETDSLSRKSHVEEGDTSREAIYIDESGLNKNIDRKIAQLLKANSELAQQLKIREEEASRHDQYVQAQDGFNDGLRENKIRSLREEVEKLHDEYQSATNNLRSLDNEHSILLAAEDNLSSKIRLLQAMMSKIQIVEKTTTTCLALSGFIGLISTLTKRRLAEFWKRARVQEADAIPFKLGILLLISGCIGKICHAFENLRQFKQENLLIVANKCTAISEAILLEKSKRKLFYNWYNLWNNVRHGNANRVSLLVRLEVLAKRSLAIHLTTLVFEPQRLSAQDPLRLTHNSFKRLLTGLGFSLPQRIPSKRGSIPTLLLSPKKLRNDSQLPLSPLKPSLKPRSIFSDKLTQNLLLTPRTPRALIASSPQLNLLKSFFGFALNSLKGKLPPMPIHQGIIPLISKIKRISNLDRILRRILARRSKSMLSKVFMVLHTASIYDVREYRVREYEEVRGQYEQLRERLGREVQLCRVAEGNGFIKTLLYKRRSISFSMIKNLATKRRSIALTNTHTGLDKLVNFFQMRKVHEQGLGLASITRAPVSVLTSEVHPRLQRLIVQHQTQLSSQSTPNLTKANLLLKKAKLLKVHSIMNLWTKTSIMCSFSRVKSHSLANKCKLAAAKYVSAMYYRLIRTRKNKGFTLIRALANKCNRFHGAKGAIEVVRRLYDHAEMRGCFKELRAVSSDKAVRVTWACTNLTSVILQIVMKHKEYFFRTSSDIKIEGLDQDIEGMVEHIASTDQRIGSARQQVHATQLKARELERATIRRVIRNRGALLKHQAVLSLIKPISHRREHWMFRHLARLADRFKLEAVAFAFNAIYSSKLVLNVYELQTKRDDAYRQFNESSQSLLEDYAMFNTAFNNHATEKARVDRRMGLHKGILAKTLKKISERRLIRLQKRFMFKLRALRQNKREGFQQLIRKNPLRMVWNNWQRIRLTEVRRGIIRALKRLIDVVRKAANSRQKPVLHRIRDYGKEKVLRSMAEQVIRMRREIEKYSGQPGSGLSSAVVSPRPRQTVGSDFNDFSARLTLVTSTRFEEEADRNYGRRLFRGWKAVARNSKATRELLAAVKEQQKFKLLRGCIKSFRANVSKKQITLDPLSLKTYHPPQLVLDSSILKYSAICKMFSSLQYKQRQSLSLLKSFSSDGRLKDLSTLEFVLISLPIKISQALQREAFHLIRERNSAALRDRIATNRAAQGTRHRLGLLFQWWRGLTRSVGGSESSLRGIIRLRNMALKKNPLEAETVLKCETPVQVRKCFYGWKIFIARRKFVLKKLTPAFRALRTWRETSKYKSTLSRDLWFRQRQPGTDSEDEMEVRLYVPMETDIVTLKEEFSELRDLVDQSRECIQHGRRNCEVLRRQIRLDLAAAVEGATWYITKFIQKLIVRRKKIGLSRMKFFSGGPGLVESKIMLKAISKQLEGFAAEKTTLLIQTRQLDYKMKQQDSYHIELRKVTEETIQIEDDMAKVDGRLYEQRSKNEKLRAQLQRAMEEKDRLVSILRQAV